MSIKLTRIISKSFIRFLRCGIRRKLLCLALILSLIILPSDLSLRQLPVIASTAVEMTAGMTSWASSIWNWLFGSQSDRPQRLTLADRIARVSSISVSPSKMVGYQGETLTFNALPSDSVGKTVQGVRLSWESSDTEKLQIDNTGQATLINPGLVQIICHAGSVESRAWVLIRQGQRPVQVDEQWNSDQNSLTDSGSTTESSTGTSAALFDSLIDKLAPTVSAQNGGDCDSGSGIR
jgi:hypothetical protein